MQYFYLQKKNKRFFREKIASTTDQPEAENVIFKNLWEI